MCGEQFEARIFIWDMDSSGASSIHQIVRRIGIGEESCTTRSDIFVKVNIQTCIVMGIGVGFGVRVQIGVKWRRMVTDLSDEMGVIPDGLWVVFYREVSRDKTRIGRTHG